MDGESEGEGVIWFAIIAALIVGYIAGAMRTFVFCGYWVEPLSNVLATLQPRCGGWWRGERVFRR